MSDDKRFTLILLTIIFTLAACVVVLVYGEHFDRQRIQYNERMITIPEGYHMTVIQDGIYKGNLMMVKDSE